MRRRTYLVAGSTVVTGALAGCLGGDTGSGDETETTDGAGTATVDDATTTTAGGAATTEGTTSPGTTEGAATVTVATSDEYGEYLTDADGVTLYLFTNDEGGESVCYDGCAQTWPPLTVEGTPTGGEGVSAELGTTERRDGSVQVTAGDWPLYYYAADESPGDTNGQGVGGVWYLVSPDGSAIDGTGNTTGSGTRGGGGIATADTEPTTEGGGNGGSSPY